MPFGLINGPATFTRFIDMVLGGLRWSACLVYMDDILVHSRTFETHVSSLRKIFRRMSEFGLTFKAKKCFIAAPEVRFLGHVVSAEGIKTDPDKIKALREMPIPVDKDAMRSALGMFGHYRKFCRHYSQVAAPLTNGLKKSVRVKRKKTTSDGQVQWTAAELASFEQLRTLVTDNVVLAHPDWNVPFEVHTDACSHGIGATLVQKINDVERVVSFISRSLTEAESKYNIFEKECLAIIWACSQWYSLYLYGRRFTLVTDNEAVSWLFKKHKNPPVTPRIMKWIIKLQDLRYDMKHRKGTAHCDADGLSRNALRETAPYGEAPTPPLYGADPPIACCALSSGETTIGTDKPTVGRNFIPTAHPDTIPNGAAFRANRCFSASCLDFQIRGGNSAPYFDTQDKEARTTEEWRELQQADSTCATIIKALSKAEDADEPSPPSRVEKLFCMKDGLLYHIPQQPKLGASKSQAPVPDMPAPPDAAAAVPPGQPVPPQCVLCTRPRRSMRTFDRTKLRIVVPTSLKAFILYSHHGLPIAGHDGRKRVYASLCESYYWDGMAKDTRRWVRACTTCARRKTPRPQKAGSPQTMLLPGPAHTWSLDLQGPFPVTKGGNRWILSMVDCYIKWAIAVPLPDTRASTICDAIFRHLLCQHGRPQRILTDRGAELIGLAVQHLCKRWGINKIHTTGHQPQASPVERFHRYLNTSMTALHGSFGLDWDRYVDAAVFTYRVSYCESTGYSPFFLLYGRDPVRPQAVFLGQGADREFESEEAYSTHTCTTLAIAYENAYQEQLAAAHHNIAYREKFMRQVQYSVGQRVLYWQPGMSKRAQLAQPDSNSEVDAKTTEELFIPNGSQAASKPDSQFLPEKWSYKWTGPHTIVAKIPSGQALSCNVYEVRHANGNTFKANVNRLAKFHPWSDKILSTSPEASTVSTFKTDGQAEIGSLIVIPFPEVQVDNAPVAIGKVLVRDDSGGITFQWLWNNSGSMLKPVHLGWINSNGEATWKQPSPAQLPTMRPYTNLFDAIGVVNDRQVMVHGFKLDSKGRLPTAVLQFLSESDEVPWSMPL